MITRLIDELRAVAPEEAEKIAQGLREGKYSKTTATSLVRRELAKRQPCPICHAAPGQPCDAALHA